ncbi:MAG: MFS transporter, partial [bacterium]
MKKLTTLERNWILYDVGNSAYTLLITTIIPIYFNSLATAANVSSVDYLAYWGYAASITTLIVAISGPLVGTLSDRKGSKKIIFNLALFIGALGCILMGFAKQWLVFLIVFIISKVFYQIGNIIYDSMLADVTTEDRVDIISAQGYAWGYIGSGIPFVVCLIFILGGGYVGIPMSFAMFLSLLITAVWWVGCTVPLFKTYKQINYNNKMTNPFSQLLQTIKGVRQHKKIFFFLIAFFFYIDGVYTIIDMATAYGSTLGLGTTDLLLALLVTQIVAFPSAIIIGQFSRK